MTKKIAELPNGQEVHFPLDTPDADMDAAVKKFLSSATGKSSGIDEDLLTSLLKTMSESKKKREEGDAQRANDEKSAREEGKMLKTQSAQQMLMAAADIAQTIEDLPDALREPLEGIAAHGEKIDNLVEAVKELSTTIKDSVREMIDFAKQPRHIQTSADGTPTGIQIGGTRPN